MNERSVPLEVEAVIRRAVAHDLPALATWSGNVESTFRPALETGEHVLLVALANGRFPIGHVLVNEKVGALSHLLVLGGFRDQGLGSALMDGAERLVRDAGLEHVRLAVEKSNTAAIRLYARRGYKSVGQSVDRWPEPGPDGSMREVDHPSWVMEKRLG